MQDILFHFSFLFNLESFTVLKNYQNLNGVEYIHYFERMSRHMFYNFKLKNVK